MADYYRGLNAYYAATTCTRDSTSCARDGRSPRPSKQARAYLLLGESAFHSGDDGTAAEVLGAQPKLSPAASADVGRGAAQARPARDSASRCSTSCRARFRMILRCRRSAVASNSSTDATAPPIPRDRTERAAGSTLAACAERREPCGHLSDFGVVRIIGRDLIQQTEACFGLSGSNQRLGDDQRQLRRNGRQLAGGCERVRVVVIEIGGERERGERSVMLARRPGVRARPWSATPARVENRWLRMRACRGRRSPSGSCRRARAR